MSRYKILPLPFPYTWEEYDPDEDFGPAAKKIEPIFNRDGWYYDRETKRSWIECKQGCWEDSSPGQFLYVLSIQDHRMMPPKVRAAVITLINYKVCPTKLKRLFWKDNEVRQLHDTYWRAVAWRLSVLDK